MQVCCLTELQARQFEHDGVVPDCLHINGLRKRNGLEASVKLGGHLHIEFAQAEKLVGKDQGDGQARWVGGRFMIASNLKRGWNSVRSAGMRVMQMTRETPGFRHPGETARVRKNVHEPNWGTTAREVNQPQSVNA